MSCIFYHRSLHVSNSCLPVPVRFKVLYNGAMAAGKSTWLRHFDVVGDDNQIYIGAGSEISGVMIRMRGSGHRLEIGRNSRWLGGTFWFEDSGCWITLGEGVYAVSAELSVTEPGGTIIIGRDSLLAYDIDIRNGDSHSTVELPRRAYEIIPSL